MIDELLEALGKAIEILEGKNPSWFEYYNWNCISSCNCGILARQLLTEEELSSLYGESGYWAPTISENLDIDLMTDWSAVSSVFSSSSPHPTLCTESGMKIQDIFKKLEGVGLNTARIEEIEYLLDEDICKEANIDTCFHNYYEDKDNVLAYFKVMYSRLDKEREREEV